VLSRDPRCLNHASCHPTIYRLQAAVRRDADVVGGGVSYHVSTDSNSTPAHRAPSSVCTAGCFPAGRGLKLTLAIHYSAPRLRMHEAAPAPTYALLICCCVKHNGTTSPLGVSRLKCIGTVSCRRLVQSFRNPLPIGIFLNLTFQTDLRRLLWFCQNAVVFSTFRVFVGETNVLQTTSLVFFRPTVQTLKRFVVH
jgi:hypothetical protein